MALIAEKLEGKVPPIPENAKLFQPPIPIMRLHESNWPLLTVSAGWPAQFQQNKTEQKFATADLSEVDISNSNWDGGDDQGLGETPESGEKVSDIAGGDLGAELDLGKSDWDVEMSGLDELDVPLGSTKQENFFVAPQPGPPIAQIWTKNSNLAADHVCAGSFESAMQVTLPLCPEKRSKLISLSLSLSSFSISR